MAEPSLYAAVLGERFAELAPTLQRFHGPRHGGRARGTVEVRRGSGPLARLVAWVMGAPPAGEDVPVELRVELDDGVELWTRHFAGRPFITRQWQTGARLVEAVGPSQLHFDLRVEAGDLVFEQRRCFVLGLPIPPRLAPRIEARASARDAQAGQWDIFVSVSLPLIGFVVSYAGLIHSS